MKYFTLISFLFICLSAPAADKPNIVFFLVDDLGIKDLACYGSDFHESPNIDKLANDGMLFTNAYAAHPVCGPSRSAIVTGCFPARLGVTAVGGKIPKGHTIWPQVLKDAGYKTWFGGKWHMGGAESVLANGFDFNVTGSHNGQPGDFYYPYKAELGNRRLPKQDVLGMEDGQPGDYLTDKLTDKALNFLDEHGKNPFLLYFSYYNVHKPFIKNAQGKKEHTAYFNEKLKTMLKVEKERRQVTRGGHVVDELLVQRNAEFAAQIKAVDDSVGRIMTKLENLGISENTIVIFTSDQGSMCTSKIAVSSATPYSFGKAFAFEGGIRVPYIIKWPGQMKAGTTNATITINTDTYPTVLDMLGLELRPEQHVDGISLKAALNGKELPFDRNLYWTFPTKHPLGHKASVAMRQGPYKIIFWPATGVTELYNVEKDISESNDLSKSHPELTGTLMKKVKSWEPMQSVLNKFSKTKK
jgi:arylsulfatase A-like enzyme